MNHRAFTLMELMIVIVIIGILAAGSLVIFSDKTTQAKIAVTKTNYKSIEKRLLIVITSCKQFGEVTLQNSKGVLYTLDCTVSAKSGDQFGWAVYNEVLPMIDNAYDGSRAIYWSNGSCSPKPDKGKIMVGYCERGSKNYCKMGGGNTSFVMANIGDKDGNDSYLSKEFNICDF